MRALIAGLVALMLMAISGCAAPDWDTRSGCWDTTMTRARDGSGLIVTALGCYDAEGQTLTRDQAWERLLWLGWTSVADPGVTANVIWVSDAQSEVPPYVVQVPAAELEARFGPATGDIRYVEEVPWEYVMGAFSVLVVAGLFWLTVAAQTHAFRRDGMIVVWFR